VYRAEKQNNYRSRLDFREGAQKKASNKMLLMALWGGQKKTRSLAAPLRALKKGGLLVKKTEDVCGRRQVKAFQRRVAAKGKGYG